MGAQAGTFFLFDAEVGDLFVATAHGYPLDVSGLRLKMGQGLAGECAQTGQPVLTADIAADPRLVTPAARAEARNLTLVHVPDPDLPPVPVVYSEIMGNCSGIHARRAVPGAGNEPPRTAA